MANNRQNRLTGANFHPLVSIKKSKLKVEDKINWHSPLAKWVYNNEKPRFVSGNRVTIPKTLRNLTKKNK